MMMMVSANNLMTLYLGLELQSLPLYVLAAFNRDELRSTEAGLKYFVLGALVLGHAALRLLAGLRLHRHARLRPHRDGAARPDGASLGLIVGLVFIVAGLAFKVSAVPFHMWTPDVYEGAPTPVTAFIGSAPKVAAIGLITRLLVGPFGPWIGQWQQIVDGHRVASMFLGAFAAIGQTNIKRLMAYAASPTSATR